MEKQCEQSRTVNVRVEYDPASIRHISFQCPQCLNWFAAEDVKTGDTPSYYSEIESTRCRCPMCGEVFGDKSLINGVWYRDIEGDNFHIEEVGEGEALKGVKRKTVSWE